MIRIFKNVVTYLEGKLERTTVLDSGLSFWTFWRLFCGISWACRKLSASDPIDYCNECIMDDDGKRIVHEIEFAWAKSRFVLRK